MPPQSVAGFDNVISRRQDAVLLPPRARVPPRVVCRIRGPAFVGHLCVVVHRVVFGSQWWGDGSVEVVLSRRPCFIHLLAVRAHVRVLLSQVHSSLLGALRRRRLMSMNCNAAGHTVNNCRKLACLWLTHTMMAASSCSY